MHNLAQSPSQAYRRVDLDARIEASHGAGLALICLEELRGSLAQAALAHRRDKRAKLAEELARAATIIAFLDSGIDSQNPMRDALRDFYRGVSAQLRDFRTNRDGAVLDQLHRDIGDLIEAIGQSTTA